MEEHVRDFLWQYDLFYRNKSVRNTHVDVGPVRIYTRRSHRSIDGKMVPMLDIASVNVDVEFQKKGYFTAIVKGLLEKYPADNFFIESIVNENVRKVGERFGFKVKYQGSSSEEGYDMYLIR